MYDIRSLKQGVGRFYNMEDQVQRGRVAVIGSEAKEKLFSGRNAVGEYIRLDSISFEVVGVLAAKMQDFSPGACRRKQRKAAGRESRGRMLMNYPV